METSVELLLFEVAGRPYAVDASHVARIDRVDADTFALDALGPLSSGGRALVFQDAAGERRGLRVDAVHGVRAAALQDLRRMPPAAGAHPYAVGVWLDGEKAVLLIDLNEGAKFHQQH